MKIMKSMSMRMFFLALVVLSGFGSVQAQVKETAVSSNNKHEIRLSVSDGLPRTLSELVGFGIFDALLGTKRTDAKTYGVYSLGYRYSINRIRIGSDLAFASTSSKISFLQDETPSYKESNLSFLVLPTFEYQYYKKGIVELYGSVAAGVDVTRTSYDNLGSGKTADQFKANYCTSFAYQVNPIAIRVGNDRVGGFMEAGLGVKGFLTAGISVRF